MKSFQKGGSMGEVLNFVTLDGSFWKKKQNFCVFLQKLLNFKTFLGKFRFERSVLSSENLHKISIKTTEEYKLNY